MLFQKFWTTPTWEFAPLKMCNFQEFSTSRGSCSKCIARKFLIFRDLVEFTTYLSFPNFRSNYFVIKCDFWVVVVLRSPIHANEPSEYNGMLYRTSNRVLNNGIKVIILICMDGTSQYHHHRFLGGQSWGFVYASKYFHIFDDPPQATQKYEHLNTLLFLLNLACSLIILAVSKL